MEATGCTLPARWVLSACSVTMKPSHWDPPHCVTTQQPLLRPESTCSEEAASWKNSPQVSRTKAATRCLMKSPNIKPWQVGVGGKPVFAGTTDGHAQMVTTKVHEAEGQKPTSSRAKLSRPYQTLPNACLRWPRQLRCTWSASAVRRGSNGLEVLVLIISIPLQGARSPEACPCEHWPVTGGRDTAGPLVQSPTSLVVAGVDPSLQQLPCLSSELLYKLQRCA